MSQEFKDDGIAVNALWPRTSISTAAVNNLLGIPKKLKIKLVALNDQSIPFKK